MCGRFIKFYVKCWGDTIANHKLEEHSMGCSSFSLCGSIHEQYVSEAMEITNTDRLQNSVLIV